MVFIINPDGNKNHNNQRASLEETANLQNSTDAASPPSKGPIIKDSDTDNFVEDVINTSGEVPVLVDFWAPWCGPCKQLTPTLERLVTEAAGKIRLVKINVDENQALAQQMQVQSIPVVYAFYQGQPVDAFTGALPESQIKTFIEKLTGGAKNSIDTMLEEADSALDAGDYDLANQIYTEVHKQSSNNARSIAGLIRIEILRADIERAQCIVNELSDEQKVMPEIKAAIAALDLVSSTVTNKNVEELIAKVNLHPLDHQLRFELAMTYYTNGENAKAIDSLIYIIDKDRLWQEEKARKQLLKIFEALGATDENSIAGRRKLSTVLFS